jgi:hypothetical protein
MNSPKKILITVPNQHWIHKTVVNRVLRLQQDDRYALTISFPSQKPFENNLHHIIVDLLKGDWDYWLTIDADNPPEKNPLDLVELDKDVIGCPTPIIHFSKEHLGDAPVCLNAFDAVEGSDAYSPHRLMDGLQRVDVVGTGCALFARRVFENPFMQTGCFERKLNLDGTVNKGNDFSFCERAREQGFEIWAHYDYICSHINEVDVNEMQEQYGALFNKLKEEVT